MRRWCPQKYPSVWEALQVEPVEHFEDDGKEPTAILEAIMRLKEASPRCLPLVTIVTEDLTVLHVVLKGRDPDVAFQDRELAERWIDYRVYRARMRFQSYLDLDPDDNFELISHLVGEEKATVPPVLKSVWEWLRDPAL
jgi:hypothetical protein